MEKVKKPKVYKIYSFEQLGKIANKKNQDMLFGCLYGAFIQFIEIKKKQPKLKFQGINWIDDGKMDILKPKINIVVTEDLTTKP